MALLVIAVPEFSGDDYDLIQSFRAENDVLFYHVVEPHFTLVFPVFNVSIEAFKREVIEKSRSFLPFDFKIRCATINKDAFNNYHHAFLVPDEGFSHLIKLHDSLYSGLLADNLRLDIDFIPHVGVGNDESSRECQGMVQFWNNQDFCISGRISKLQVVEFDFDTNILRKLEEIPLERPYKISGLPHS
ncbi:2'-5' RNA ligase family protein [Vibrio spartinae]|uniref:2'-5' RNA ligase family protein n=2 Tax=Vibrio spartinae TaxID=1918945 RepID=UPI0021C2FC03|nr:2'-5' RNA ligase family protein [Vibrio spartinae]